MNDALPLERPASQDDAASRARQCAPEVLALFQANLCLVEPAAARIAHELGASIGFDELRAAGQEGLFLAARRYDPARQVPFAIYANYRIRGAILDAIRDATPLPRRAYERLASMEAARQVSLAEVPFVFNPRAPELSDAEAEEYLDEHLATIVTAATAAAQAATLVPQAHEAEETDPEELCSKAELLEHIRKALIDFDEIEGRIIELMYFEGQTLEQAGNSLNIGKSWTCRLHARAMARLTKRLRNMT